MKSTSSGVAVISSFALICHFWIFVSCDDPCSEAVYIGGTRRSAAYPPDPRNSIPCGEDNDETWYRFETDYSLPEHYREMPDSCASVLHCKSLDLLWMNGQHPMADDPGPKTVEVCAPFKHGDAVCCQWKGNISVKYCQEMAWDDHGSRIDIYYVYRLKKPPSCDMYYCSCRRDCAWKGVKNKCICPHYPAITEAPELKSPRVITGTTKVKDIGGREFFPTRFVVDCEVKYPRQTVDDGARFDVVFDINGHSLANFTVNSINPVATLDESFLVGHLGKELTCKVSSNFNSSDGGGRYLISNRRWFGLIPVHKNDSVISQNLVVKEGEKVSLWMKPTFPITTRPCFDSPHLETCIYSSYRFQVSQTKEAKLSDCQITFNENSSRSDELEIAPIPDVGATPKPVVWQLNFERYNDAIMSPPNMPVQELPIFKDYRIQGVNIEVRDRDAPPQCQSIGDPHITAFPNAAGTRNYYHAFGVGDFYLVRHRTRQLEIQVRHARCNKASCNCGVIAREGNSIIGITKCNQRAELPVRYELERNSPSGTIRTIPGGWEISLLSGIAIKVTRSWQHLNLFVTGLSSELTHYDGLCSATTTTIARDSISNCSQYRVPEAQSFFSVTKSNLPPCGQPFFVPECTCKKREPGENGDSIKIACETPRGDYLLRLNMQEACKIHKRQVGDNDNEDDDDDQGEDLISLEDFNDDTAAITTKAAPRPGSEVVNRWLNMGYRFFGRERTLNPSPVLTEEDGRRRCEDALRLSTIYELCSGRVDTSLIVKSCALDVEILNDYGPSKSVPTQFETTCLDNIRISLESYASSDLSGFEELKDLLTRVEKLVCPSQCSQNGRCVDSECQCDAGFMGTDCSLRIGQVPVVHRIIMPVCDIRKHPCTQIHLVASDLTIPENVVCKMRSVDNFDGAVPAVQFSTPVISGGMVLCNLPRMPVSISESSDGISTTVFLVQVSISNDDQTFSKELPFTVYDGHCMKCSQTTTCQLKENTCSIGGRCYRAEVSCPQDATRICNPSACTTRWTDESSTSCDDGFENCT